ncbi:MAG: outer membrane protein transport protein [Bacteroidota bacterium]
MMRWIMVSLIMTTFVVKGEGFRMNSQGVKASGMGGFAAATSSDASVVYFNPAGVCRLEQSQLCASVSLVFPRISYLDPYDGNVDMDPSLSIPVNIYGVAKLKGKISAGIGIYTPFSENISWDENWTGRYITIENRFRSLYIQPVISYAVNDKFSIGGGPVIGWAGMKRKTAIDAGSTSSAFGIAEYKSAATGFGYTAGILAILNRFSIGITYHSAIKLNMENGKVTYSDISNGAALLEGIPSESDFSTELNSPASIDGGINFSVNDKLDLSLNTSYTFWSILESSDIEFTDHDNLNFTETFQYDDAFSFSGGGSYRYTDKMSVRAGVGFTKTHVPDGFVSPAHPDADQLIYSGGVTYKWNQSLKIDLSFMVRDYKSRQESGNMTYHFNGDYKSTLYIAGIGINYEF